MENEANGLEVETAPAPTQPCVTTESMNEIHSSKLNSMSSNEVTDKLINGQLGQENDDRVLEGAADNGDAIPVRGADSGDQMNEAVKNENGIKEKEDGPETSVQLEKNEVDIKRINESDQSTITETTMQDDIIVNNLKTHSDIKPTEASAAITKEVSSTKKTATANTVGSTHDSSTSKGKKASPTKTVSSRLFAPTASSQNKLRDKIDKEGHPEPVKKAGERTRPLSAPPNTLSRTSTPRTRPTTARTAPVSPTKSTTKKTTGTWGTPPPRKAISTWGKPPPPKQAHDKTPQTKPTGRPSSAHKTDPSTKWEREVTNGKSKVGSTVTKSSATTVNGSPSRISSATTKRTVTTTPTQRVSSTPTTVRTKTLTTQSEMGPDGKVRNTKTTSLTKGGPPRKAGSITATRTVITKESQGPQTVTTTQKGVMSPRHKSSLSSPRKMPPQSPSHNKSDFHPESLTLSPRHAVKSEPGSPKPSMSPGRYPIHEYHELGRSDAIVNKLNEFRNNKIFTDLILKVGKNDIYCHRMMMAACSDYFRETLSCTFSASTDIIDIRGVQGSVLQTIVDYAYTSKVSVPKREVNSILEAANLFQIDTLSEACNDFVTNGELAQIMNQPKPTVPEIVKQAECLVPEAEYKDGSKKEVDVPVVEMSRRSPTFDFYDHHHNNKILHTLHEFRPTSQFADVILKSGHEILPCHRALLSACSDYFLSMFTEKKRSDTVAITEIKGDVLKKLIDYIYTSKIAFTERDLYRVFEAAKKLLISDASQACFSVMAKILNSSTCLKTLKVADTAGNTDLAHKSREYALSRFVEACQFEYFPHISKERLVDLVSSDELCVPKEELVFVAIMSWVDHDAENRQTLLPELLPLIRFKHISESFISDDILVHQYIKNNAELMDQIEKLKMVDSGQRKYGGSMLKTD
ncbi:uncharacterized protein LOC102809074 [Saccoglossus kowalevskii]|uniref:Uncharacterized protein LOC102809074 n=1 Tax=Saccoglossus kowalevskii TaxID=10224 RepID=A0ABM0MV01_SACKO|nr:PREDICTED: uncharacterized protein LOC102809074 [Saccoglossus kowalevskii]